MLLSLRLNNWAIFQSKVEFSAQASGHYRRFPNNVATIGNAHVLKSAVLFGPNNTGKTKFVRAIQAIQDVMLNRDVNIDANLFSEEKITEISASFLEKGGEYMFELHIDTVKGDLVYERFAKVKRNSKGAVREQTILLRDSVNEEYRSTDQKLSEAMKTAAKNNILIYLMDIAKFPVLQEIKSVLTGFASRIDVLNSNDISIQKTIEMMKRSEIDREKVANLIRNADLDLDDYRYLDDDEFKITLDKISIDGVAIESALTSKTAAPLFEMLHLTSFYRGIPVPSLLYDSTGTKKIAALASYVVDALQHGRILVVDELDSSLHFKLTRAIISLFNNELNTNAQLIATVHDTSLLDCKKLFRKDQIWFTHKERGNAYLYSLAEFTAEKDGVRDTSDLTEKYRKGVFGAVPEPDLFQTLLEVRDNGETAADIESA